MWAVFGALLGLVAGSFLATLALRWPAGRNLRGRSHCDSCNTLIPNRDLWPVLSWVWLKGRSRCCGQPIDKTHPLMEITGALIGAISFHIAPGIIGLGGALLGWVLMTFLVLDLRHHWLPDRLTLPLLPFGLWLGHSSFTDRLLGSLVGAAAFLALALLYQKLTGRVGLGMGDIKLVAALGAWLGLQQLPLLVLGASIIGLGMALVMKLRGQEVHATTALPLGAFLALMAWPLWVGGAINHG